MTQRQQGIASYPNQVYTTQPQEISRQFFPRPLKSTRIHQARLAHRQTLPTSRRTISCSNEGSMVLRKRISAVAFSVTLVLAAGCSLQSPKSKVTVSARIALDGLEPQARSLAPIQSVTQTAGLPTVASQFNCIGLNVIGNDISPTNPDDQIAATEYRTRLSKLWSRESYCSYAGLRSLPVKPSRDNNPIQMSVSFPSSGEARLIQVVGVIDPEGLVCNQTSVPIGSEPISDTSVKYYEIGRTILNTTAAISTEVDIGNEWNRLTTEADRSARIMNQCGASVPSGSPSISPSPTPSTTPAYSFSSTLTPLEGCSTLSISASDISGSARIISLIPSLTMGGNVMFFQGAGCNISNQIYSTPTVTIPSGATSSDEISYYLVSADENAVFSVSSILDGSSIGTYLSTTINGCASPISQSVNTGLSPTFAAGKQLAQRLTISDTNGRRLNKLVIYGTFANGTTATASIVTPSNDKPIGPVAGDAFGNVVSVASADITVSPSALIINLKHRLFSAGTYWLVFSFSSSVQLQGQPTGSNASNDFRWYDASNWYSVSNVDGTTSTALPYFNSTLYDELGCAIP